MPMFYFCFLCYVCSKVYLFAGSAHWILVYAIPAAAFICGAVRGYQWRNRRKETFTPEEALEGLKASDRLLHFVYPFIVAYDLALYVNATPDQRMVLIIQLILTPLALISFMADHKASAKLFLVVGIIPTMVLVFATQDLEIGQAVVISFAMIVVSLLTVMRNHYNEFDDFVRTQVTLESLSQENLRLANVDTVTSLPNRREFFRRVCDALANADVT